MVVAAAMEGGVYDLQIVCGGLDRLGVDGHGQGLLQEGLVGLLADPLNEAGLHGFVEINGLEAGEDVDLLHLFGDGVGVVGGQLSAVGPVDLIAVVLLGVVAGGDVQTRGAAVVAHGKAQLRGGAQLVENTDMDAVGGHDAGGLSGKLHAVEAAVVGDGDALPLGLFALSGNDVGEGLGGMADHVDVHMMQAQLHGTAQAGRAELQGSEKAAFDLLRVVLDGVKLCPLPLAEGGVVQPALVFFHKVSHTKNSLIKNF